MQRTIGCRPLGKTLVFPKVWLYSDQESVFCEETFFLSINFQDRDSGKKDSPDLELPNPRVLKPNE